MRNVSLGKTGSASINGISKGEIAIIKALKKLDLRFYRESVYPECRGGAHNVMLPFDLSVYVGKELVALIEYQGSQHFIPTFGMEDWVRIRANDEVKKRYCKEKGIPLLEVPYYKFREVDKLVMEFLRQNGILNKMKRMNSKECV